MTKFILLLYCQSKQSQMDSALRERLFQLTQKCQILSKSGKYVECIDIMEEIVSIKKQVYGMDHLQFEKASQKLCEFLNLSAMVYLQKEKYQTCLDFLRKAELVARNSLQYKSITYNNLACYYRRTGKIRTALTYLIQALELELKLQHPKTLADTHLNLCAVLSQLDRHEDALQHVMLSIILLQDQFLGIALPQIMNNQLKNDQQGKINDQRLAVLAIAYHNLGVQFQHLKRFQQAVKIYKKALSISKQYLSQNQQLIQNLTKVVNSATSQIQDKKKANVQFRRQKIDRDFSQNKHNIYKDFARQSDKLKHLPKLRINKEQFSINSYEPSPARNISTNQNSRNASFNSHNLHSRQQSQVQRASRSFASRKHPRYYKSYALGGNGNGNQIMNHQSRQNQNIQQIQAKLRETQRQRYIKTQHSKQRTNFGSVPVSQGLQEFDAT